MLFQGFVVQSTKYFYIRIYENNIYLFRITEQFQYKEFRKRKLHVHMINTCFTCNERPLENVFRFTSSITNIKKHIPALNSLTKIKEERLFPCIQYHCHIQLTCLPTCSVQPLVPRSDWYWFSSRDCGTPPEREDPGYRDRATWCNGTV